MKLIIFGAGASYYSLHTKYNSNSSENELWKPPLANEIFSNRVNFIEILKNFDGAMSLKSQAILHPDLEEYFQELWDFANDNNDNLSFAKIINTQYFLQKLFMSISDQYGNLGDSNYDVISNFANNYSICKKSEILFVSFNYDILLERALERVLKIKFNSIDDYLKYNIKYIKPHGSCNWFRNFGRRIGKGSIGSITGINPEFFTKKLYEGSTSYEIIEQNLNEEFVLRNQFNTNEHFGLPQLLIPIKNKDEFVLPPNHFEYLENYLEKVEEILIIGWKGTEEKFKNVLRNKLKDKNVNIIAITNGDKTIISQIRDVIPNSKISLYSYKPSIDYKGNTDTFTNFIKTQILQRNSPTFFFK